MSVGPTIVGSITQLLHHDIKLTEIQDDFLFKSYLIVVTDKVRNRRILGRECYGNIQPISQSLA